MTAYCLQNAAAAPYQLTIFEASGRLGGKLLTPRFTNHQASYEAGAAEFYDYTPVGEDPLKELVQELGLFIRPMDGGGLLRQGRVMAQLEDFEEGIGGDVAAELRDFHHLAKDLMTPREFYEDDPNWVSRSGLVQSRFDDWLRQRSRPEVRRVIEELIHSDLATETSLTSLAYGLQNYLMNDPAYMKLYSIEGGNEQLVTELARRIAATIKLGQRVVRVEARENGKLAVLSKSENQGNQVIENPADEFDYLVLALPSGVLRTIDYRPESLAAALRAHDQRFHHPAHYLRITLLFSQPFWRSVLRDSFCMLEAFDGCCLYDESSRYPESEQGILGWLLGGESAVAQSDLTDEALIELALASLPEELREGRKYLLEGQVHRWVGEVSGWPGGIHPVALDARHQPAGSTHPNVFLVGDYLYDSTLNGVLDSANYVADWLAAEIHKNIV